MALTNDDLKKIKAVVDARADLQDVKLERLRSEMATKNDLRELEARLTEKMATKEQVEEVKEMLTEDIQVLGGDVRTLKRRIRAKTRAQA